MSRVIVSIGTKTSKWGEVKMVGWITGERYYWMVDKLGCVSMMPAAVVESEIGRSGERQEGKS